MKTTITLFLVVLFFSLKSFSQTIEYAPVNDYPTLIANIFGVQCEGVSNVQVQAHQMAIGRFENGIGLGLTSGLAMTTGLLVGSNTPSGNFNSYANNFPPDIDIYNFGAASGQTPVNYDACIVQFDFTPLVSDTVRFTYILASEEYPEYSPSSYTDRFLFLVSENGGVSENVAILPGTTTTVEINTVNPYVNPQFYLDNAIGPNSQSFVYDGYTLPFEAKFFTQVGSTYHIKLVIADVNDAIYDSAIFLDEQDPHNDIYGDLTINGQPAEGIIEIFNFVQDTILATPVAVIPVTNGTYLADSLSSGLFHVRFTPDPILFPSTAPFYYVNGDTWNTATAIGLPCFLNSAGISLSPFGVQNGNGTISGTVTIDTSYTKSNVDPLDNALLKLYDNATGEAIDFTYSDVNGMYQFNEVSTGDYFILIDVPYIPQVDTHAISIQDGQVILGADFEIALDGIHALDNLELALEESQLVNIQLYPNPVTTELSIVNPSTEELNYEIYGMSGKIVASGTLTAGVSKINLAFIDNGVYLLKSNQTSVRRIIIRK
jgi:hypothetical protein